MRLEGVIALTVASLAVTVGMSSTGLGLAAVGAQSERAPGAVEERLAVVNAAGGTFTTTDDGYQLVLDDVASRAVWFDDRPGRDAGSYSIAEVEDAFFKSGDPPNAALEVLNGRAAGDVVVVEVSDPRYQPARQRLVLDARVLKGDELATVGLPSHVARVTDQVPRRFGAAALFIDGSGGPCLASFWTFPGEIEDLGSITCETAQAVLSAATAQHPEDSEASGGRYYYDFAFVTETWHADDLGDRAFFSRTDHDVAQGFSWYDCARAGC